MIKISITFLIMIYGCCTPSVELSDYKNAEKVAKEKFGVDYQLVKNTSSTFILCSKKSEKKNQPHSILEYFIYDMSKEEIIFEEKLFDAEIKWIDDHNVEIRNNPEIVSDDDVHIFILNVLTKEKYKSNSTN